MHLLFLLTICFISVIVNAQNMDKDKKRKYEVIFIGLALFLFAALRHPSVGIDLHRYCENYINTAGMSFSTILSGQNNFRDPVFHCFTRLLSIVSKDPQFMLVVVGAWVAFSFSYFAYHSKGNVLITYLLFICLRIYSFTFSGLRQAMAMGFVWIAMVFLLKNKKLLFILFVLFGSLFHASAIAFILALPLILIKDEKIVLPAILAVTAVNFLSGDKIVYYMAQVLFPERFDDYIDTAIESGTSFSTTFFLYVAMFLFVIIFFSNLKKNDNLAVGKFNIVSVGVMFSFIAQGFPNMFRVAYYFICNLFPLFAQTIECSTNKHDRTIINSVISVLLIAQYVILGTSAGTENYMFFWQG